MVEGCSWRQPCVDAFEECKAPVHDYLHSFCEKKKKWVEDKDLVSHPVGVTSSDWFFFLTKADKLLHQLSRIHGAKGETWVCGLPGPERSGDRVRHRSHRDASEFHNNSCAAARLLCQRVASQAGKIGACKLSVVELWKQPQMKCWVGKKINMLLKCLHDTFRNPSMGWSDQHSKICQQGSLLHFYLIIQL